MTAKTKPKIGPLSVWIVGHPQNPLIYNDSDGSVGSGNLAVFLKKKEAVRFKQKHPGTFYKVMKATVIRDDGGPDYKAQLDAVERELAETKRELAAMDQWGKDVSKKNIAAWQEVTAKLQRALEDSASSDAARQNAVDMLEVEKHDHAATEQKLLDLQKKIHDGKVWNTENPRLTPRAQAAIALAHKEATASGATYVGTEHLLLGMLRQGEGIAKRHFLACGMSYDKAEYAMRVGRVS